ncbi:hypothetical protein E2562_012832 [Oryza meyeriana var. granulata]|uniref:Uncharacterized protein n=1 Tax=Oryza meyeriana var. granulata TaxID=110450 RepID=A0A6G1CPM2_9ORYZ|nr:hypothetical protein E2562_012832 [Oryza meyeriana var. granulata]
MSNLFHLKKSISLRIHVFALLSESVIQGINFSNCVSILNISTPEKFDLLKGQLIEAGSLEPISQ